MKMVKSLLLGSAAGLVAVAGAQAADLPVKAKPVEYVKVCSLYGAGFFYMPGTDTCIKLGGYLRSQYDWNAAGDGKVYFNGQADARETRTDTNPHSFRHRAVFTVDTRTQTEYGTLRSYMAFGGQQTTPTDTGISLFFNRAFIQFAGFTTGRSVSFYDFLSLDPYSYNNTALVSSTGAAGINVFAYTAQLGNGVSATISAEDGGFGTQGNSGRTRQVVNVFDASNPLAIGTVTRDPVGNRLPDIVGALRVDQAWGSAQIMAAAHDASGGYYGGFPGSTLNGHPGDEVGWAVGAGLLLKNPLGLGAGDVFHTQVNFESGAVGYLTSYKGAWDHFGSGNSVGFGSAIDAVFSGATAADPNASSVELVDGWGFGAVYEHHWNPKWKTSLYGGYSQVNYGSTAKNIYCTGNPNTAFTAGGSIAAVTGIGTATRGFSNCDPDFSWWQVGSRTQWNPVKDLDVGVDVLYTQLNTANAGTAVIPANGARPAGVYNVEDQNDVSVMFRVQRNFLP
jgi:hypothetical protein